MNDHRIWYESLKKPSWTLQPRTIGRIWSLLYPGIIVCTIWTIAAVAADPSEPWLAAALLPHGLWVTIATALMLSIWRKNR